MNRLAEARTNLATALADVLPGRVHAYPLPRLARGTAPAVWLDRPTVGRETVGARSRIISATFPVWIVVDGADRAQLAALDDIVAAVWDYAEATTSCEPRFAQPRDTAITVGTGQTPSVLPGYVVDVAVTIAARTLCPPDVASATIPPELVEVP